MKKKPAGIHPEDIKALIRKKGYSLKQLSLKNGLCHVAVSAALRRPYYHVEQLIAEFINIPATKIWPERYDDNGLPLHRNARSNRYTPYSPDKASLNDVAA